MKRDMNLIREILLRIEEHDDVKVECPQERLAFHLLLLSEQDFISGVAVQEAFQGPPSVFQLTEYVRLTAAGHGFLDSIRDEAVWKQTLERVSSVGGGVTISVLAAIATGVLKEKLGLKYPLLSQADGSAVERSRTHVPMKSNTPL